MKYPSGFTGSVARVSPQTTAFLIMNKAQQVRNRRLVCCYYFGNTHHKAVGRGERFIATVAELALFTEEFYERSSHKLHLLQFLNLSRIKPAA